MKETQQKLERTRAQRYAREDEHGSNLEVQAEILRLK